MFLFRGSCAFLRKNSRRFADHLRNTVAILRPATQRDFHLTQDHANQPRVGVGAGAELAGELAEDATGQM
jgi:hypothetical protein